MLKDSNNTEGNPITLWCVCASRKVCTYALPGTTLPCLVDTKQHSGTKH